MSNHHLQGRQKTTPTQSGVLQRRCACGQHTTDQQSQCTECRKKRPGLYHGVANAGDPETAPPIVHEALRSPGHPLDRATRAFMEPRFGHNFSRVRVHTDAKAAESALAVNALAYTVKQDVVFGAGRYAPGMREGKKLLAHELAHVVQQQKSAYQPVESPSLAIMPTGHPSEREAHQTAQAVETGASIRQPAGQQTVMLQRQTPSAAPAEEAEDGPLDTITQGIGEIAGRVAEGAKKIFEGIKRIVRCIMPATENPRAAPLDNMSTFQSPGGSGWRGAMFGCYRNNCTRRHRGWDVHAPVGTPIKAVVEGTVIHRQNPGGFGDYIILRSSKNADRTYLYAHLSQREPAGDYCYGDNIGATGVTGNADANRPHLHFEVQTNNTAQDPAGFLTQPTRVVEQVGSAANAIDESIPAPCMPC